MSSVRSRENSSDSDASGVPGPRSNVARGRRPKFSRDEDLILVREVAVAKAHVAGYDDVKSKFAEAASRANQNGALRNKVTPKSIQDRYVKLQKKADIRESVTRGLSGIAEDRTELDELLSSLAEEQGDFVSKMRKLIGKQEARNRDLEMVGDMLVSASVRRSVERPSSKSAASIILNDGERVDEHEEPREDSSSSLRRKKRRQGLDHSYDNPDAFAISHRTADMARLEIDKERLVFKRERFKMELEERKLERKEREQERNIQMEERKTEREANNMLELEKFKLMMSTFSQAHK
jgi:hypothetical protein